MSTSLLTIHAVPADSMSPTNFVYINSGEALAGKVNHVMINGTPYVVKHDSAVKPGTFAMNAIQRKTTKVSIIANDRIDLAVAAYVPPKDQLITRIVLEVDFMANRKGGVIDAQEFTAFIHARFDGQYFVEGQKVYCQLDSAQKYVATIQTLEVAVAAVAVVATAGGATAAGDDSTGTTTADTTTTSKKMGQLNKDTTIMIKASSKSELRVENISDEQLDSGVGDGGDQPVVNPFNLEDLGIGGMKTEFGQVFRRAFASRIFPKSVIKKLGIRHVKGILLHGPPGTGKTLIARKIGQILNCAPPKIVNGPEVFNKFVGGTEANIRELFKAADEEQKTQGDKSQLHLIIFDEFDAICKQRGAVRDNTGVADNVVNQLLSKIDGVDSLNNVLLIGMTNRKDLLDDAILRPGRFEVHVEIGLPDESGRAEIFRIHTRGMRESSVMCSDVDLEELAANTKNFSGAEIEGVVVAANSHAMNRHIDFENPSQTIDASTIKISMKDFTMALKDITPAFGQAKDECGAAMRNGIIHYGPQWGDLEKQARSFINRLKSSSSKLQTISLLLEGPPGVGKSAAAAHFATLSGFPFVKFISCDTLVGYSDDRKSNIIRKAFEDAYKSDLSVIVLDDIERLIEYSHMGGRYSNVLLQCILVLVKRPPPIGKKVLIIGTTSLKDVLNTLEVSAAFSLSASVPSLGNSAGDLPAMLKGMDCQISSPLDLESCVALMPPAISMKKLILVLEMACEGDSRKVSYASFQEALHATGVMGGGY